jgi:hypothetical protein
MQFQLVPYIPQALVTATGSVQQWLLMIVFELVLKSEEPVLHGLETWLMLCFFVRHRC